MHLANPKGDIVPFKIYSVKPDNEHHEMPCGALICDGKKVLKIATADGFVKILELQMAGKKRNLVEDFLRGNSLTGWKSV